MKKPKPNTLVKFADHMTRLSAGFEENEQILFLGEITNMKGHCIVVHDDGRIVWGWHTYNFVALTDEET